MREKEIIDLIKDLALNNGFYARMYNKLTELKEKNVLAYKEYIKELENQNFQNYVELILYLES